MREFFQVWNPVNKTISTKALIVRHPDFGGLFVRGDAAAPYRKRWKEISEELVAKYRDIPAADRKRIIDEMLFASGVEENISFITNAIAGHVQFDYATLRKDGFIEIFKLLAGEKEGKGVPLVSKKTTISHVIPAIAQGYEEVYRRFLNGVLIYRPQEGSDVGRVDMPIAELVNPLEGTFDLSRCDGADHYLSISTGYRKEQKSASYIEIWIAPRFLITAAPEDFQWLEKEWSPAVEVGIFWNLGSDVDNEGYDYLITRDMNSLSKNNFNENWKLRNADDWDHILVQGKDKGTRTTMKKFLLYFG